MNHYEFITVMPFFSEEANNPLDLSEPMRLPVRLYRSDANVCEQRNDHERCDPSGCCYGVDEADGGSGAKWCARHWYENHFRPDATFRIIEMTASEHRALIEKLHRERREVAAEVSRELMEIGSRLDRMGFADKAGELYRMSGAIRLLDRS